MTRTVLTNCHIFTGRRMLSDHAIVVDDSFIVDVMPEHQVTTVNQASDLGGSLLAPGLIDLQVNGGGGVLFNDRPDAKSVRQIGEAHRSFGTTGFLPTLISDTEEITQRAIAAVDELLRQIPDSVLGIHLEGPHLNSLRKGVHDASLFRPLDDAAVQMARSLTGGRTLLTIAPELTSPDIIRKLVSAGVIVSAGHTDATYEVTRQALDAGMSGFTHLFNAMSPLQSREPGVVGAALEDQHSWCGVIADGEHVHWATLRTSISAKPRGKIFLVTDAMPTVGTPQKSFQLFGQTITRHENSLRTESGHLAGSNLDMISAVRNVIQYLDVPLEEALRMASLYPATFLGVEAEYGRIEKGYRANMLLLDHDLNITRTWVSGEERQNP